MPLLQHFSPPAFPVGVRRCSIFGSGLQEATLVADQQWVIPTGGGYFFVPALSASKDVIAK